MGTPYAARARREAGPRRGRRSDVAPALRWLEPARSPASHYRNKAKLVVGGRSGNPTLGILDEHGRGVDLRRCGLYEPGWPRPSTRCTASSPTSASSPTTCPPGVAS